MQDVCIDVQIIYLGVSVNLRAEKFFPVCAKEANFTSIPQAVLKEFYAVPDAGLAQLLFCGVPMAQPYRGRTVGNSTGENNG
jgi:hypothetical protein